jgi:hypothetical protein
MAKVVVVRNPAIWSFCWIWTGSKDKKGYGCFRLPTGKSGGKGVLPHRWSYEHFVGPIPDGMELDHYRCFNPSCVRPSHLKPATSLENSRNPRGRHYAVRTHCKFGHEFTPENTIDTYTVYNGRRYKARGCKICYRRRLDERNVTRRARYQKVKVEYNRLRRAGRMAEASDLLNGTHRTTSRPRRS